MFKKLLRIEEEPQIQAFYGLGTVDEVLVLGRVTETIPEQKVKVKYSAFDNLLVFLRSYFAKPYSGIAVECTVADKTEIVFTNEAGVYQAHIRPSQLEIPTKSEWIEGKIKLRGRDLVVPCAVLIQGADSQFGVISDIDDTVLVSNATKKMQMVYSTIFKNATARVAFPGVSDLYVRLRKGKSGAQTNPFFYVSSSHWNLFEFLTTFFQLNTLPQGPLLLKEAKSLRASIKSVGNHSHKSAAIETVLQMYPQLPFILIGDSGQQDAAIYSAIYQKYPKRILEIYIRDISKRKDTVALSGLEQSSEAKKIVVVKDSEELIAHATAQGYIN